MSYCRVTGHDLLLLWNYGKWKAQVGWGGAASFFFRRLAVCACSNVC